MVEQAIRYRLHNWVKSGRSKNIEKNQSKAWVIFDKSRVLNMRVWIPWVMQEGNNVYKGGM